MTEDTGPVNRICSASTPKHVSRRGFLVKTAQGSAVAGSVLLGGIGMSGTATARGWGGGWGWGGPVWKSTARYRDYPNGPQMCANCRHFRPPTGCAIVESPISPRGWSRFWEPRRAGGYGGGRGMRAY